MSPSPFLDIAKITPRLSVQRKTWRTLSIPLALRVHPKALKSLTAQVPAEIDYMAERGETEGNTFLFKTNYIFDVSVSDLFSHLSVGAKIVMTRSSFDLTEIEASICNYAVNACHFVPSQFSAMGRMSQPLAQLYFSGESLTREQLQLVDFEHTRAINYYGPTETGEATSYIAKSVDDHNIIGKPFNGTQVYVLNGKQLAPIGAVGELYIGGAGLARGYLNQPELTAERFIDNPFLTELERSTGDTRLYKTGDLVRWHSDGNLEYLGRNDQQVKIRGYRIELAEVENALAAVPDILQAVVVDREHDGGKFIAAYFVTTGDSSVSAEYLRETLSAQLPDYMVPASFTLLDSIPLTINGKLDRRALPEPALASEHSYTVPRTALETKLCEIWQALLGLDRVGIDDNFFRIGGNSISAIRLTAVSRRELNMDIPLAMLFKHKTIAQLVGHIDPKTVTVIPATQTGTSPLSFAQERLLFIERFEEGTDAYHIPLFVSLKDDVNWLALREALLFLTERHPILKTVYRTNEKGEDYQQVLESTVQIPEHQFATQQALISAVQQSITLPFDLTSQAPVRFGRYQSGTTSYLLIIWHHIAFDGWSTNIFMQELAEVYQALCQDKAIGLPPLDITYADYAIWQRAYLQDAVLNGEMNYWRETLKGYETLVLPTDKPRPSAIDYVGKDVHFCLPQALSEKLRALAKEQETTLYSVLLSGFYVTLATLSGQSDLVIGTPSDNRHHAQTQSLLGFFVNSLVLRTELDQSQRVDEFIQQVHGVVTSAKVHQELPFEKLVDALNIEKDLSRHPIFQIMFSVQSFGADEKDRTSLPFLPASLKESDGLFSPAKFDLSLFLDDGQSSITGSINYAVSLFDENSVERLAAIYQAVLGAMVDQSTDTIGQLDSLPDHERHTLLHDWNQTDTSYPRDEMLHQLFEEQVEKAPDEIAIVFQEERLSYRELNEKANQLAHVIRARYQERHGEALKPDTLIALYFDRSIEMLVGILAVLKAGGAYVPISPEYPRERTLFILEDTATCFIITKTHFIDQLKQWTDEFNTPLVLITEEQYPSCDSDGCTNLTIATQASHLAYVIYTSGTTGNPKGVMIEQGTFAHYIEVVSTWLTNEPISILSLTKYTFDIFGLEFATPLLTGGCLFLSEIESAHADLEKHHVDINLIQQTPSMWQLFLSEVNPSLDLSHIKTIVGGESGSIEMFRQISQMFEHTYQVYGPTESCIWSSQTRFKAGKEKIIGKPFAGESLYVLSENLHPLPIGAPGELYIGGAGLARGYLNLPELTAERFIDNPFVDKHLQHNRLYKTGDMVRWMADGNLEYLGRNDRQVKIRGHRIELAEIEAVLAAFPDVKYAAVIDINIHGNTLLAAYGVPMPGLLPEWDKVKPYMASKLPGYMVPSSFTVIDSLPLTANGKLDSRALPEPDVTSDSIEFIEPSTATEYRLAELWHELLNVDVSEISANSSFFLLGGNSLLLVQLRAGIKRLFLVEVPIRDLVVNDTLQVLAENIEFSLILTTLLDANIESVDAVELYEV